MSEIGCYAEDEEGRKAAIRGGGIANGVACCFNRALVFRATARPPLFAARGVLTVILTEKTATRSPGVRGDEHGNNKGCGVKTTQQQGARGGGVRGA